MIRFRGSTYKVKRNALKLSGKGIQDISELVGLENLTDLKALYLSGNQITEIKGLGSLKYLKILDLRHNKISEIKGLENLELLQELYLDGNNITEIKGLENLFNLKVLSLSNNPIPKYTIEKLGGFGIMGYVKEPQNFVAYSSQKKKRLKRKGFFKLDWKETHLTK